MQALTRDDIAHIINSPLLDNSEIIGVIKDELRVDIDPDLTREEMVEAVFEAYQVALEEVAIKTKEANQEKKRVAAKRDGKPETVSRKQFIINLIEEGKYTKESIIDLVSEEYNYGVVGKKPTTRVGRVLRELNRAGKLEILADGILRIK
jgi:ribosomal protein L23